MDVVNLHTLRTCIVRLMPKYSLYNLSHIFLPVLKEYKSQAVKNNSITNVLISFIQLLIINQQFSLLR
jgi:hypothetical protein